MKGTVWKKIPKNTKSSEGVRFDLGNSPLVRESDTDPTGTVYSGSAPACPEIREADRTDTCATEPPVDAHNLLPRSKPA